MFTIIRTTIQKLDMNIIILLLMPDVLPFSCRFSFFGFVLVCFYCWNSLFYFQNKYEKPYAWIEKCRKIKVTQFLCSWLCVYLSSLLSTHFELSANWNLNWEPFRWLSQYSCLIFKDFYFNLAISMLFFTGKNGHFPFHW